MTQEDERRRIERVYAEYDEPAAQARWDPANRGNRAVLEERDRAVADLLATLTPRRVLDLGCGDGSVLAALPVDGATRVGVDLLADRLRRGRADHDGPPRALALADGRHLPLADGSVDLTVAFTLLSSVLDPAVRKAILAEVARVTAPGGAFVWYDLRRANPRNPAVRPVSADEVAALLPRWRVDARPLTLLPPVARRLGPATRWAYPVLGRLRPLRSHLIGCARAPR